MKPLVVFAYNFPHKKTQDVLIHLFLNGYQVGWVFAADYVDLGIPKPSIRTKIRHTALLHPARVAHAIGAQYRVVEHNSEELASILDSINPDLGIIAGARILKKHIIDKFAVGIINLHPGLIPEARGLDAMLWSIYKGVPLGVTAHLIDERVDAGRILIRKRIQIFADDTIFDLSERLYETQLEILPEAIEKALRGEWQILQEVGLYNRKMPEEIERQVVAMFEDYKRRYMNDNI